LNSIEVKATVAKKAKIPQIQIQFIELVAKRLKIKKKSFPIPAV